MSFRSTIVEPTLGIRSHEISAHRRDCAVCLYFVMASRSSILARLEHVHSKWSYRSRWRDFLTVDEFYRGARQRNLVPIVQKSIADFIANQYLVYTFATDELSQIGQWTITAYIGDFTSNPVPFQVVPIGVQ